MTERKKKILDAIVREHITTKTPVGSSVIADKYRLDVSSATVRNVMAQLEEEGYIIQPYTSAGRIPTAYGYKEYMRGWEEMSAEKTEKRLKKREKKELEAIFEENERWEIQLKNAAKVMARSSENAVFLAFHQYNMYYTGISDLLSQPEFSERRWIFNISSVIDRMDEIINENFENFTAEPRIMIGPDNPFGLFCGSIVSKYKVSRKQGLIGILGPLRMDYKKNFALVSYTLRLLSELKNNK